MRARTTFAGRHRLPRFSRFLALAFLAGTAGAQAGEETSERECRHRCAEAGSKCEAKCAKAGAAMGLDCKGLCGTQVEVCEQRCGAGGGPAAREGGPEESPWATGMRTLALALEYRLERTVHLAQNPRYHWPAEDRSTTATALEARANLEVAAVEYGRDLDAFTYLGGELTGPESLQQRGKRVRLPAPRLVSLEGEARHRHEGKHWEHPPMAKPCESSTKADGSVALRPGAGSRFTVAFAGERAVAEVTAPPIPVTVATAGSCGEEGTVRREEGAGTAQVLAATAVAGALAAGLRPPAHPACTHSLEASGGSYRGAARCQRRIEGGTETETLRFTVELGPMPRR